MATKTARKASMAEDAPEEVVEVKSEELEEDLPEEEDEETTDSIIDDWDTFSMDPEEELYNGGPKIAQINAWKKQYGRVFVTDFMGEFYIWRTLTRFEYRRLVQNVEQAVSTGQVTQARANLDNEEAISEMCVLHPEYNRTSPNMAGLATTLASQIMEASAFSATDVREL